MGPVWMCSDGQWFFFSFLPPLLSSFSSFFSWGGGAVALSLLKLVWWDHKYLAHGLEKQRLDGIRMADANFVVGDADKGAWERKEAVRKKRKQAIGKRNGHSAQQKYSPLPGRKFGGPWPLAQANETGSQPKLPAHGTTSGPHAPGEKKKVDAPLSLFTPRLTYLPCFSWRSTSVKFCLPFKIW